MGCCKCLFSGTPLRPIHQSICIQSGGSDTRVDTLLFLVLSLWARQQTSSTLSHVSSVVGDVASIVTIVVVYPGRRFLTGGVLFSIRLGLGARSRV